MLTRLWSEEFKDDGTQRPAINFRPGLNTIRGGEHAENSIGKSTLLSVIDFAFGGKHFLDSTAIHAVGHHTIYFSFKFDGTETTYSRHTEEFGYVQVYKDLDGKIPTERISTDDFRRMLQSAYGLADIDVSFDAITERFFRIQEHATGTATQPMRANLDEPSGVGVAILEHLFGIREQVAELERPYKEADSQLRAFNALRKHDLLQTLAIKNVTEYKDKVLQLDQARQRLAALNGEADQQLLDLQQAQDHEVEILQAQRHSVRTRIGIVRSKIKRLEEQMEHKFLIKQAQLRQLQQFFPGVDVRRIEEVEHFHVQLTRILEEEFETQHQAFRSDLEPLEKELGHIESELRRRSIPVELSPSKYQEIGQVAQTVELLRQQVESWEVSQEARDRKEAAKKKMDEERPQLLIRLEREINAQIAKFDKGFHAKAQIPPELHFDENKKYDYRSRADDGTGTTDKNLILFDLAILALTGLPAVIHDSPIIKNISDSTVEKILDLYQTFAGKQIFIAFDKDQSYTTRSQEHIQETAVIQLGEDKHALYGFAWNKAESSEDSATQAENEGDK